MAIKVGGDGPLVKAIKVGAPSTVVKKVTIGVPITTPASSGATSIHNIDGTLTGGREHGHILIFDSSRDQPNPNYRTSAILAGSGLNKNLNVDSYNPALTFNIDSAELQSYFRPTIRGYFSGQGDLSYDSASGIFSFDVENLYTQTNFDSDLGAALAGGVGITYDSASDTINITDTGVDSGQYGTATLIPVLTINSRGQIDSAGTISVAGVSSTAWDSSLSKYTISTADGGSFPTIINGWSDNQPIYLGDSNDLKIYHNGTHSYIEDNGTGSLIVATNNLTVKNATKTENQITALSGGAVTLYHNDSAKLLTTDSGATITGSLRADSATITNINRMGTTITAGTYGTAVKIPKITIDSSGFIDSAGEVDVAGVSSVSFDSASYNYTINTADGGVFTQMIHTRKPGLAAGTHGSAVLVPQITINQYGLVDSIGTVSVAGVSSTAWDSATGLFTINTADGGVFNTTIIMDSDFTRTRVRSSLSASGDLSYDSATGVFSFDVENVYTKANFDSDFNVSLDSAVLEGVGLTYNDSTNTLDIDSAELESYFKSDIRGYLNGIAAGGDGSFTYDSASGTFTYTGPSASETRAHFSASNSLSYNSGTGDVRAPQPLDSAANPTFNQLRGPAEFIIDPAAIGDSTGTVRILGNLRVDGVQTTINSTAVSVADKNIIIADSATDSAGLNGGGFTWGGDDIVDNPTFTYSHSDARLVSNRNIQATTFVGQISDISNHSTTNLSEGSNLYYTTARADSDAKASLFAVDAGGDGSFAYDSSTGVMTYTGPSASEVRAHFTGGTGIAISSGDIKIDSSELTSLYRPTIRGYFSGQGDLSYDSSTGVFSLDVETVYTSSNFDSDLLDAGYDDLDQSLLADSSVELTQNLTTYPIYDYSKTTYRSSKHLVQATKGSKYQISEILLIHDGSTVHMTEYGKICIGDSSLAYYDASIVGDNVQLKAQPVEASTTFKSHNTLIKV